MNADSEVMRHFPAALSRGGSDALVDRAQAAIAERGWGLWAVEVLGGGDSSATGFAGFIGLAPVSFDAHFTPAVEIGWRLAQPFWGRGYATEGARAALTYAFVELELEAVVSFTAVANDRSRRVMERLSMTHDPGEDFNHPKLPGSPVERHALYRLRAEDFAPGGAEG